MPHVRVRPYRHREAKTRAVAVHSVAGGDALGAVDSLSTVVPYPLVQRFPADGAKQGGHCQKSLSDILSSTIAHGFQRTLHAL